MRDISIATSFLRLFLHASKLISTFRAFSFNSKVRPQNTGIMYHPGMENDRFSL